MASDDADSKISRPVLETRRSSSTRRNPHYWNELLFLASGNKVTDGSVHAASIKSTPTVSRTNSLRASTLPSTSSRPTTPQSTTIDRSKTLSISGRSSSGLPSDRRSNNGTVNSPRSPSEKSKMGWIGRIRGDHVHSKGTVLRAVPDNKEPPIRYFHPHQNPLLPLDEAMITAPNAEVLSAIGRPSTDDSGEPYVSPLTPYHTSQLTNSLLKSPKKRRMNKANDGDGGFIGTWKDDKIHWASGEVSNTGPSEVPRFTSGDVAISAVADQLAASDLGQEPPPVRPGIKVQIPSNTNVAPITQPTLLGENSPDSPNTSRPGSRSGRRLTKEEIQSIISPLQAKGRPQHPLEAAATAHETKQYTQSSEASYTFCSSPDDDNGSRYSGSTAPSYDLPTPDSRSSYASSTSKLALVEGVGDDKSSTDPVAPSPLVIRSTPISDKNTLPKHSQLARPRAASSSWIHSNIDPLSAISEDHLPTPEPPPRSRKRDWISNAPTRNFSRPTSAQGRPSIERRATDPISENEPQEKGIRRRKTEHDTPALDRVVMQHMLPDSITSISSKTAESIIYNILEHVHDFKDLFATVRVNKGFYNVFKRNELKLLKNTLRNISPAAWELRESSPKEIIAALERPNSEYTPMRYMQFHTRDTYIIQALKSLMLVRCQSYLRADTIRALADRNAPRAKDINEALWRIWTFCTIFGSGKGREDDIVGQIDWLRGGDIANQSLPASTIRSTSTVSIDSSSILLNAPESFAKGNLGGLSAEELYDMTEMWNCICALLSPIYGDGRAEQARPHGIFQQQMVDKDDRVQISEERLLEEWVHFISTQGLSTICDLASPANSRDASVFMVAADMGWNEWKAPEHDGSRSAFLKEAVSRVYEERIAALKSPTSPEDQQEAEAKRHRRLRSAEIAQELRLKKRSTDFSTLPYSEDRPMSMWLHWMNKAESPVDQRDPSPNHSSKTNGNGGHHGHAKPTTSKPRTPHGVLSLFPPQYRNGSANSSTRPSAHSTAQPSRSTSPTRLRNAYNNTTTSSNASSRNTPHSSQHSSQHSNISTSTSTSTQPSSASPVSARQSRDPLRTNTAASPNSSSSSKDITPSTASALHSPPGFIPVQEVVSHIQLPPSPEQRAAERERNNMTQHITEERSVALDAPSAERPAIMSSSDRAIERIVEMGFDREEAKRALMKTDRGAGLDVDRAVAVLLAEK